MTEACRILIIEDEYFLADDLERALRAEGAEVVGPIGDLAEALAQVDQGGFDAAVIDINLHDQDGYVIADKLIEQHIPFVFATGYGAEAIPDRFWEVRRFEKPYDVSAIAKKVVRVARERRNAGER